MPTRGAGEVVDSSNEGSVHVVKRHHRRELTKIRRLAASGLRALTRTQPHDSSRRVYAALEKIAEIAGRNDARELKPRPSLRKKPRAPRGKRS